MIINKSEIFQALEISHKAYDLLMWLESAMEKEFISPQNVHTNLSSKQSAEYWLLEHIENLPPKCRPDIENKDEVEKFMNFFTTYLWTSFDIEEEPGKKLYSEDAHCFCPICSYLVNVPHLRPKKLTKRDKAKAKKIKILTLWQYCLDRGFDIPNDEFHSIIQSEEFKFDVSLLSYCWQLVQRTQGISNGPAVLALWREIAWNEKGSPKKKFNLDKKMIENAFDNLRTKFT